MAYMRSSPLDLPLQRSFKDFAGRVQSCSSSVVYFWLNHFFRIFKVSNSLILKSMLSFLIAAYLAMGQITCKTFGLDSDIRASLRHPPFLHRKVRNILRSTYDAKEISTKANFLLYCNQKK